MVKKDVSFASIFIEKLCMLQEETVEKAELTPRPMGVFMLRGKATPKTGN